MTTYAIAKRLTADRIPTKGDLAEIVPKRTGYGKWGVTTVAKMLHNETYAGVWYYGKYKKVDGKRVQNPPHPPGWLLKSHPS